MTILENNLQIAKNFESEKFFRQMKNFFREAKDENSESLNA